MIEANLFYKVSHHSMSDKKSKLASFLQQTRRSYPVDRDTPFNTNAKSNVNISGSH